MRIISVLLILSVMTAFAQIDPEAQQLLTCAQETLRVDQLIAFESRDTVTFFGPGGEPAGVLESDTLVDFIEERIRVTLSMGGQVLAVQQLAPEASFMDTPQTGVLDLPPSQRTELARSLRSGPYVLRTIPDEARHLGEGSLGGVSGEQVDIVIDDYAISLLFDSNCFVIAATGESLDLGEYVALYSEYRSVSGVTLPFLSQVIVGEILFAENATSALEVNPAFDSTRFARPQ
jgi:hypothetical protein